MRLNVSRNFILLVLSVMFVGCSAAYQRLEEASLPLYAKGTPVMSTIQVVCRWVEVNDMGRFQVSYDLLWDTTHYPTNPYTAPGYNPLWASKGVMVTHQTEQNKIIIMGVHPWMAGTKTRKKAQSTLGRWRNSIWMV